MERPNVPAPIMTIFAFCGRGAGDDEEEEEAILGGEMV